MRESIVNNAVSHLTLTMIETMAIALGQDPWSLMLTLARSTKEGLQIDTKGAGVPVDGR